MLKTIYKPIKDELKKVEEIINTQLYFNNILLKEIGLHIKRSPGKRIRPALVLLSASACGKINKSIVQTAASVELIHTATLIHDDIIDGSNSRRGQESINSKWGNQISVLFGDTMYANAFRIFSYSVNGKVSKILSDMANRICEGEIEQIYNKFNSLLSRNVYLDILKKKTASFFSSCCRVGALLSSSNIEYAKMLGSYGENLGVAFQIVDDTLDYIGNPDLTGKPVFGDLYTGKITLPMIYLLSVVPEKKKKEIVEAISSKNINKNFVFRLCDEIREYNVINYCISMAKRYSNKARGMLSLVPDSLAKRSLDELADYVINREY